MGKKRILVVDDDEVLLNMLKLRIEAEGYEFTGAKDGIDMLNAAKMRKPDVILLDIMLPKMDGYSALVEMRKDKDLQDIPVIVLSAKEKKKVGDLFAMEKVAFFVEKPFEAGELLQKIRSVLRE